MNASAVILSRCIQPKVRGSALVGSAAALDSLHGLRWKRCTDIVAMKFRSAKLSFEETISSFNTGSVLAKIADGCME